MSGPEIHIEPLMALVCDDARREDNGKAILIGIYTGDLLVPRFPVTLLLCLWIPLRTRGAGTAKIGFRVTGPPDRELARGEATLQFAETDQPVSVSLPRLPVAIESEGILDFQWRVEDSDWSSLVRKRVLLSGPAMAASPQSP